MTFDDSEGMSSNITSLLNASTPNWIGENCQERCTIVVIYRWVTTNTYGMEITFQLGETKQFGSKEQRTNVDKDTLGREQVYFWTSSPFSFENIKQKFSWGKISKP